MIHLRDAGGNAACFTNTGDLVAFSSHGQRWVLAEAVPAWSLQLLRGSSRRVLVRPLPRFGQIQSVRSGWLRATFREAVLPDETSMPLRVTVDWCLFEGLLCGRLCVEDLPRGCVLDSVVLPDIVVPYSRGEDTTLIVPRETGWVIDGAAAGLFEGEGAPGEVEFTYPGDVHFQCFGWQDGEQGLYLDCRDEEAWIKRWRFSAAGRRRLRVEVHHLAPRRLDPPDRFVLPYPVCLGGFSGGWYDVGRTYRQWAGGTRWVSRGPDDRRRSFFGDVACWLWNRGRIASVAPPAKELARRIGAPVALDWYWWHKHAYDTEYPDYFPPREGEDAFREAVRDLQAADVRVQVYTNGMCYDVDGAAWEPDGPRCAVIQEDGTYLAPAQQ